MSRRSPPNRMLRRISRSSRLHVTTTRFPSGVRKTEIGFGPVRPSSEQTSYVPAVTKWL